MENDDTGREPKRRRLGDAKEAVGNSAGVDGERWTLINKLGEETDDDQERAATRACARWCHASEEGSLKWDAAKLKCFLSGDERNNQGLLGDILCGATLTGRMHPLIFESSQAADPDTVRLRSLSFLEQLLADGEGGAARYRSLSDERKRVVAVGVRDLYLGRWHGLVGGREERVLEGMVELLDETVGCVQAKGMDISFHPSANFKVVKLMEDLGETLDDGWKPFFAQVMDSPRLSVVFVDPAELSYHNFENIIPMDGWFESKAGAGGHDALSLSLADAGQVRAGRDVWTCKLQGAAGCDLLRQLSALDIYVAPLNRAARGGERFIFHSAGLSRALSHAVRSSGVLDRLAGGRLASSFEFVNSVFRCNRFSPGDGKFASHLDTPYYDGARSHVSKHTLLVYLTGGSGEAAPMLRVGDVELAGIEAMTCVIFDQRYEHEGRPFADGDKVFIRSELVFKDADVAHSDRVASLFSEACYMTGHGVFDDQLASYAHECFERANSLHWAVEREAHRPPVYLKKTFRGLQFMTNGYNYWFPKLGGAELDVEDCGLVAVLDFFNCKIENQPFRSMCSSETVQTQFGSTDEIWSRFGGSQADKGEAVRRLRPADVDLLFKKRPDKPFTKRPNPWADEDLEEEEEEDDGAACCPFHAYSAFDAWENGTVRHVYKQYCNFTRKQLLGATLLVLNQELVINEGSIKVFGDKMYFLKGDDGRAIPPVNFAACWNGPPPNMFIDIDQEISAPGLLLLPPVLLHSLDRGHHLVLDFFRNDWMVSRVDDERKIPVPVITNDVDDESRGEDGPFASALDDDSDFNAEDFDLYGSGEDSGGERSDNGGDEGQVFEDEGTEEE